MIAFLVTIIIYKVPELYILCLSSVNYNKFNNYNNSNFYISIKS